MPSDYWTSKKTELGNDTSIEITTTTTIPAGTSITVTLFEDVANDGSGANTDTLGNNYDNSDSVALTGGVGETNTLTGFDGGGSTNAYWAHIELDGDGVDPTLDSPTVDSFAVAAESAGVSVSESGTVTTTATPSATETASAGESGGFATAATPSATETATAGESGTVTTTATPSVTETTSASESGAVTTAVTPTATETTTAPAAAESGRVTTSATLSATETATVSESGTVTTTVTPSATESVTGLVGERLTLSARPEQLIRDFLVENWNPSNTLGFDPTIADPSADGFLPVSTSVSNVGQHYPNVVVTFSNETSGGDTTYNYMTANGPGQVRDGSVIVTVRAEETDTPAYTGDSGTYSAIDAEAINQTLLEEVERIVFENANNPSGTGLSYLGSVATADAPDDLEETPIVRIADRNIAYGWLRDNR